MYDSVSNQRIGKIFSLDKNYEGSEWNWEEKLQYNTFLGNLKLEEAPEGVWERKAPVFKSDHHQNKKFSISPSQMR